MLWIVSFFVFLCVRERDRKMTYQQSPGRYFLNFLHVKPKMFTITVLDPLPPPTTNWVQNFQRKIWKKFSNIPRIQWNNRIFFLSFFQGRNLVNCKGDFGPAFDKHVTKLPSPNWCYYKVIHNNELSTYTVQCTLKSPIF